jgi:hypothetical protein
VSAGGSQSPHGLSSSINPVDFMTTQQAQSMLSASVEAPVEDSGTTPSQSTLEPVCKPIASFRRVITVSGEDATYREVSVDVTEIPDALAGVR